MFDPALNLFSLFNQFIGIMDTFLTAFLIPLFGPLGIRPPSLIELFQ